MVLGNLEIARPTWALFLEHVPAAVAMFDRDMCYIACSQRWLTDYALDGPSVIGRSYYAFFPDADDRWRDIHRRALAGETLHCELERFRRGDGSYDWVQWEIVPWRLPEGGIGGVMLFTQKLTGSVENDERARAVKRQLDLLIDNVQDYAIYMLDPEGRVSMWNDGARRLFGWDEEEMLGRHYERLFDALDNAAGRPRHQLAKAARDGSFRDRSLQLRKDGSHFLADATLSRIRDEHGVLIGFGRVVHDITDEDEWRRMIAANETQMRLILETIPDAMVVIDEKCAIQSFSAAAEKLFGYSVPEVLGRDVTMLMVDAEATRNGDDPACFGVPGNGHIVGQPRRVIGRRKDGSTLPLELAVGEARLADRRVFTGFMRDLTRRERADAQLRELQNELARLSRIWAVGTMATALAHDLNQPLAAITNYVQACAQMAKLGESEAAGAMCDALAAAGQEALRAGAIVQRLREFIARGELSLSREQPDVLARQACALVMPGGACPDVRYSVNMSADINPVLIDRVQIQQVLVNLLRNAVEAVGPGGAITVKATEQWDMMCLSVIDNGPGISPDIADALFDPFATTKSTGMGLGLSICRAIVEAHGGNLWHEAVPGGGTAFHFTVPMVIRGPGEFSDD